jgi:hypothetical protein
MKTRVEEVHLHAFYASAPDGDECCGGFSGRFFPWSKIPSSRDTHWSGSCMGHGAGLIAVKKNKKFLPQMGIELLFL